MLLRVRALLADRVGEKQLIRFGRQHKMLCPACGDELTEVKVADFVVDVCDGGCGGIWFDWFELQRVDEPHEAAGKDLVNTEAGEKRSVDLEKQRRCPRCGDVVLMRHFWSARHEVEVDECPQCAGFWLDAGELEQIRGLFETEEDRRNAGIAEFREKFGEELAGMDAEIQTRLEAVLEVTRKYRFLCPSQFVGKSADWGVF